MFEKMSEIDIGGKSNTSRCKMFCIIACSRCDKILKSIWPLEKSLELSSISDVDGISSWVCFRSCVGTKTFIIYSQLKDIKKIEENFSWFSSRVTFKCI